MARLEQENQSHQGAISVIIDYSYPSTKEGLAMVTKFSGGEVLDPETPRSFFEADIVIFEHAGAGKKIKELRQRAKELEVPVPQIIIATTHGVEETQAALATLYPDSPTWGVEVHHIYDINNPDHEKSLFHRIKAMRETKETKSVDTSSAA